MDYKKKAMAYDEALERAKKATQAGGDVAMDIIQYIFPELRESEDERITRAINNMLPFIPDEAYTNNGVTKEGVLNWLEKQKEKTEKEEDVKFHKWMDDLIGPIPVEETYEYKKGLEVGMKQKEQNLNPSKSVGLKEQNPAEWSEEEKDKLNSIERLIVNANAHGNGLIGDKEAIELQYFIRSIVKPITNIAEWSEEDEEMLNSCISSIEESKENRYAYKENDGDTSYDREIAWLKSLRPQPHWKPSEEQMTALERTIHLSNFGTEENRRKALGSLYEQLKKLGAKEEPEYYQHFDPDC